MQFVYIVTAGEHGEGRSPASIHYTLANATDAAIAEMSKYRRAYAWVEQQGKNAPIMRALTAGV
jgi:hypothetical protein